MIEGKTREETIQLTAQALGVSELEAEFIIALEEGETCGDVEVMEAKSPSLLPLPQPAKGSRSSQPSSSVSNLRRG